MRKHLLMTQDASVLGLTIKDSVQKETARVWPHTTD